MVKTNEPRPPFKTAPAWPSTKFLSTSLSCPSEKTLYGQRVVRFMSKLQSSPWCSYVSQGTVSERGGGDEPGQVPHGHGLVSAQIVEAAFRPTPGRSGMMALPDRVRRRNRAQVSALLLRSEKLWTRVRGLGREDSVESQSSGPGWTGSRKNETETTSLMCHRFPGQILCTSCGAGFRRFTLYFA